MNYGSSEFKYFVVCIVTDAKDVISYFDVNSLTTE